MTRRMGIGEGGDWGNYPEIDALFRWVICNWSSHIVGYINVIFPLILPYFAQKKV
jgi:hypothetical protein